MKYLSVCSGIEAASVAWHSMGWEPVGFSEIDPFASAVLAARFPHVPNLGNMESFRDWNLPPFDVLVSGTPCQSFSVAGLRKGLDDPRGNLALVLLGLVDRFRPRYIVWENVPGVLSSSGGRDFGSFLGALAELGYGFAYRVLDAQFIRVESHPRAVPQRRRRVFVVGHSGGDARTAASILLEPDGVRGNPPTRRSAWQSPPRRAAGGARGGGVADVIGFHHNAQACQLPTDARDTSISDSLTTSQNAAVALFSPQVIGFQSNLGSQGGDVFDGVSPTMRIGTQSEKGGGNPPAVAFKASHYTRGKDGAPAAVVPPLSADADKGDQDTLVAAVSSGRGYWNESETGATLRSQESPNKADTLLAAPMAVRRLTPRECERLQGFPDDWTAITYRGKPAADGPRYKALGNSMATNVMRFIGERIALHDEMTATMFASEEETMPGITTTNPEMFTAARVNWNTPQIVVDALLRGWGSIALDPCSNEGSVVPAALRVMLPTPERLAVPQPRGVRLDDGLAFDWDVIGPRLVYVNPPFGLKGKGGGATPWLRKAAETQVAEVVVLLPARTDTAAFHDLIFGRCDALCFWRSRLHFSEARDPAPFPSVFIYFGSSPQKFAAAFGPHGKVLIQP